MRIYYLWVFFFLLVSPLTQASVELDKKYSLKKVVPVVLNGQQNPVYAQVIEKTLVRLLENHGRFDLDTEAQANLRDEWGAIEIAPLGRAGNLVLPTVFIQRLAAYQTVGIDSVIVASLSKEAEQYQLLLAWVTTNQSDVVASTEVKVDGRLTIDSFAIGTENAWNQLVSSLPYEGTIINREGYRVIIDRGAPEAWKKRIIPAYTLESVDGVLNLIETGLIEITDPQENISFGKILKENRPFQIEVGQKFKFVDPAKFDDHLVLMRPDIARNIASVSDEWFTPTRRLGFLDVDMGASLLSFSQLTSVGKGASSDNVIYPDGGIRAELWVTRAIFFDAEMHGSMASVTPTTTGQPLQATHLQYQGQLGYRFRLQKTNDPALYVKAGIYRHHLQVETSVAPIAFTSTTFSGLLTGAGARFPINDKLGIHFEVNALLFPNFEETPFTSGKEVTSTTLMQFSMGGTYRLSDAIDINGQIRFFSAGAELTGTGTRPVAISSIQQDARSLTFGARYYF